MIGFRRVVAAGLSLVACSSLAALDTSVLQAAVRAGPDGRVVEVPPGDYVGTLVLDRPVVLHASRGARLIHGGKGPTLTLTAAAAGSRVEGLTIVGSGSGTERDLTAVVVEASDTVLDSLEIRDAWGGLWIAADRVVADHLVIRGLADYQFWQRGPGIRVTKSFAIWLASLNLSFFQDGLLLTETHGTIVSDAQVTDGRYGVHVMFGSGGVLTGVTTRRAVAGLMAMETSGWTVTSSTFTDGYRTGSAGIRLIRCNDLAITDSVISRQASGLELLDTRRSLLQRNRIEENAIAWNWGGDNSETRIVANRHRGNLLDAAGTDAGEGWEDASAHDHGRTPTHSPSASVRPSFDGNAWDAWRGLDLDHDGVGDSPYRFDQNSAAAAASRPWSGLFLGSPWTLLSNSLPGGEVLDPHPLAVQE